ncbi:hypothetical protein BO94DRAFT_135253 [Aspergillus sclerotioniger CBS 115572]|uniref:Uncharacterized protein n=1 Tax=Aspergillus sclerotioniger CBS 115572 TaxID=1450535 RepID=A0A317XAX9_9EURO|nr:hypothetical protein BO94DRAFT_135253 [Aspergillus sclerotioniger CBS 115572]PWY95743.1 hypothetical protein BO94DRAFT_135253 [Aspergillus sclerotioniger CBS 115572]
MNKATTGTTPAGTTITTPPPPPFSPVHLVQWLRHHSTLHDPGTWSFYNDPSLSLPRTTNVYLPTLSLSFPLGLQCGQFAGSISCSVAMQAGKPQPQTRSKRFHPRLLLFQFGEPDQAIVLIIGRLGTFIVLLWCIGQSARLAKVF